MSDRDLRDALKKVKRPTQARLAVVMRNSDGSGEPLVIELEGTACGANERQMKDTISGLLLTQARRIG